MNEQAKQKAAELIERFENIIYQTITDTGNGVEVANLAKQCAIICCDEILEMLNHDIGHDSTAAGLSEFYQSVKSEIEKY